MDRLSYDDAVLGAIADKGSINKIWGLLCAESEHDSIRLILAKIKYLEYLCLYFMHQHNIAPSVFTEEMLTMKTFIKTLFDKKLATRDDLVKMYGNEKILELIGKDEELHKDLIKNIEDGVANLGIAENLTVNKI